MDRLLEIHIVNRDETRKSCFVPSSVADCQRREKTIAIFTEPEVLRPFPCIASLCCLNAGGIRMTEGEY